MVVEAGAMWGAGNQELMLAAMQALNEEAGIGACIHHLQSLEPAAHQIIVADGGSIDRSPSSSPTAACTEERKA
jgi:hypothetical protein